MKEFARNYLRALGAVEGVSLLVLLLFAMPLRAFTQDASWVRMFGTGHGVLFTMYVYTLVTFAADEEWSARRILLGLFCACVPLGPFWFDRRFLRD